MSIRHTRTAAQQSNNRARRLHAVALLAALFMALAGLAHGSAGTVFAIPPEPIDAEPRDGDPVVPPTDGFYWDRPSRVALAYWAWDPGSDSSAPFTGHYNPAYVNPSSFSVRFDGCRTADEERTGTSTDTFLWTLNGTPRSGSACRFTGSFPAQGTYPVSLKITASNGTVVLPTVTQNVVIKDLLVVALGDSYASGEGAPDAPQVFNYIFGVPVVVQPARWWDERCHRSMNSASAQAAWALEKANPQISVTYLSFACSGATINKLYYKGASQLEPFAQPPNLDHPSGTGILGPYAGTVLQDPNKPEDNQIPSQISQMVAALTQSGTPRQIDALILGGGGNDMGFALIAGVCTLYYNCPTHQVKSWDSGLYISLDTQAVGYGNGQMPGRYAALAQAIQDTQLPIAKIYITEYPDSTRNDQGGFCDVMLDDVIPAWMAPVLAGMAATDPALRVPFPPYRFDRGDDAATDEVGWAGTRVLPGLNAAVTAAAQAHGWTLVDGIADGTDNLFSGHGYCATDNWIRRASEAALIQGPWIPAGSAFTVGTLHPTARGYEAIAGRIFAKMAPNLLPPPAGTPPTPPTFNAPNVSQSVAGANGWLTGHVAGVACPAGAANCALMQETASVDASTSIAGTGLAVNGVNTVCPATPALVNGVICSTQAANAQTFAWSFAFPGDGIYRLEFTVSARNGTTSSRSLEVKVDLNNPAASSGLSIPLPASGWFRTPVTATLGGADGSGAGVQSVQYQLDGGSPVVVSGGAISVPVGTDGTHTIGYFVKDFAGRQSAAQSLTVKLDQTAPAVQCSAADALWHASDVSLGCTARDGGSGIASVDASFTLSTTVASGTESANAATGSRAVCDAAGNCTQAGPLSGNQVDKKAPVISIITPTATAYLLNQVVKAGYSCTDGGAGVATCDGSLTSGSALDTTTLGAKTFTVSATDKVGNASSQTVNYRVGYNICALYDQSKAYKLGSTVPIKLQLCDATGVNVSTAGTLPVVAGLTQTDSIASSDVADTGNSNPDLAFRYDATLNGYVFNLSTKGLTTGTWVLNFTVPGDPVSHAVQFDVR